MYRYDSHDSVRSAQDSFGRPDAAVKFNNINIGSFVFNGTVNVSNSVQANKSSESFDHVKDSARPCAKGSCDDWDCREYAFVMSWDDDEESGVSAPAAPVQVASARAVPANVGSARVVSAQVAPRQIHAPAKPAAPARSFARMAGRVALATLVCVVAMVAFARLSAAAGLDLAHCLGITAQTASAAGLF